MFKLLRPGWVFYFQLQLSPEMRPCKERQILNNGLRQYKLIRCFSSWQKQIFLGSLVSFRHHATVHFIMARDNPISCPFPFPEMEFSIKACVRCLAWGNPVFKTHEQKQHCGWLGWFFCTVSLVIKLHLNIIWFPFQSFKIRPAHILCLFCSPNLYCPFSSEDTILYQFRASDTRAPVKKTPVLHSVAGCSTSEPYMEWNSVFTPILGAVLKKISSLTPFNNYLKKSDQEANPKTEYLYLKCMEKICSESHLEYILGDQIEKALKSMLKWFKEPHVKRWSHMMVLTMLSGLESLFRLLLQALESKAFHGQRYCSLLVKYW